MAIKLDRYVQPVVELLNSLEGVKTYGSCNGHGYDIAYVGFSCDFIEALYVIHEAVYAIRWDAGDDLDLKSDLWELSFLPFLPKEDTLYIHIEYQLSGERVSRMKTKKAWNKLRDSLQRSLDLNPGLRSTDR